VRRPFAFSLVLLLCACGTSSTTDNNDAGNGTDYAPPYVGAWTGTADIVADGQEFTATSDVPIEELGTNLIELHGFCSDTDAYSSGPQANVSSTGFNLIAGSCSYSSTNCDQGNITFAWSDGTGTLTAGTLSFNIDGSLACGTLTVGYTLTFSSSSKGPYGSVLAPSHPAAALASPFRGALQ
jgi:hypothetical protein